jgi:hypothetical protein
MYNRKALRCLAAGAGIRANGYCKARGRGGCGGHRVCRCLDFEALFQASFAAQARNISLA